MAKLNGFTIAGTYGNICIYRMNGQTYLRSKSSLSRKRVLKSKAFEKTRKYAGEFARAARLASAIYRELPTDKRNRDLYQKITGEAASMLYRGMGEEDVMGGLWGKYVARMA